MMKLLIIDVTSHMPQNGVSDTIIMHVTLSAISAVVTAAAAAAVSSHVIITYNFLSVVLTCLLFLSHSAPVKQAHSFHHVS
jgi:hypothetical protein